MTIITTTVEINSQHDMQRRLESKNTKAQLARALARIWNASKSEDAVIMKEHIDEVISAAVWGY